MRPLAVTTAKRWFQLPDVPTVEELGYPDLKTVVWFELVAQSKMPDELVTKMNQTQNKVLTDPKFAERLREQSLEATPSTPRELATFAESEHVKWKKAFEESGASLVMSMQ